MLRGSQGNPTRKGSCRIHLPSLYFDNIEGIVVVVDIANTSGIYSYFGCFVPKLVLVIKLFDRSDAGLGHLSKFYLF